MSYYQTQPYSSYGAQQQPQPQQQYAPTAYANASQYTPYQAAPGTPSAAYPVYSPAASKQAGMSTSTPPPYGAGSGDGSGRVEAPEFADVDPQVASRTMCRLLSSELRHAGFDSAEPAALELLELETVGLIERLFRLAHDYANNSGRARPIATDLLVACGDVGFEVRELHQVEVTSKKRKREGLEPEMITLLPPPSRSPSPELLDSDEEDPMHPIVPVTLRSHPHYLPPLPPKHTYLRTPAAQPKRSTLPSLEKKLKNAGLVQESLKHLLEETEVDSTDPTVKFAMGNIINWEAGQYIRKRWKVSGK